MSKLRFYFILFLLFVSLCASCFKVGSLIQQYLADCIGSAAGAHGLLNRPRTVPKRNIFSKKGLDLNMSLNVCELVPGCRDAKNPLVAQGLN